MASNDDVKVYQDKKAKAEDYKGSAYTLLIVGIIGIAALICMELGVLPFQIAAPGKYITYLVMGALFLIFIIMGISLVTGIIASLTPIIKIIRRNQKRK